MGEKRRQYTREFKVEAVRLPEESSRSRAQVARDLGIHESAALRAVLLQA
jgi:transposase-like protein